MTKYLFIGGHLHGQIRDVAPHPGVIIQTPKPADLKVWTETDVDPLPEYEQADEEYHMTRFNLFGVIRTVYIVAGMSVVNREAYMGKLLSALFDTYLEVNGD